jgi:serine/threonine protein kinase
MNENTINNDVTIAGQASVLAGRYRIIKQLGKGGMGSVWLAEDTQLDNKLFAIKMLPSILVSNKRAYNQLKSEALVAMKLVHPNIVQMRAFEENNGNPFLVMDYIDGETLDDWLGDRGQELGCRSQELGVSEEAD